MGGHRDDMKRSENDDRRKHDKDDARRRYDDDDDDRRRRDRKDDDYRRRRGDDVDDRHKVRRGYDRDDRRREENRGRDERSGKRRIRSHSKESERKKGPSKEEPKDNLVNDRSPYDADEGGVKEKLNLSIDETNKLRLKLGLAPLNTDTDKKSKSTEKQDVHAPAINIGDVRKEEELRETLETLKESRRLEKEVFNVPLLCNSDNEDESFEDWLEKFKKQREDSDRVNDSKNTQMSSGVKRVKKESYTANDLTGMVVEHDIKSIKEGKELVYILKDKDILDDSDDILENVEMIQEEKTAKNIENKKKKPVYNPYDCDEFDEDGNYKPKEILSKYDEEINGLKKMFYIIGQEGQTKCKSQSKIYEDKVKVSLKLPDLVLANDCYSPVEMATFKKPKSGKRNMRTSKVKVTVDNLLSTLPYEVAEEPDTFEEKVTLPSFDDVVNRRRKHDDDDDDLLMGADYDNDDLNFFESNIQIKRIKKEPQSFDDIYEQIKSTPVVKVEPSSNVVFRIGHVYGSTAKVESQSRPIKEEPKCFDDDDDVKNYIDSVVPKDEIKEEDEEGEEMDTGVQKEEVGLLCEEPIIDKGVASALKFAQFKRIFETESKKTTVASSKFLPDTNYTIEDKRINDPFDKKGRKLQSNGPLVPFKERNYNPKIEINHLDDHGNPLEKKEAFRHLSHKFHGKKPGKKKTEQRIRRMEEEVQARKRNFEDSGSYKFLKDGQIANNLPYVVLKGK